MTGLATNVLSYGDNLDILRRYLPDAAVDAVSSTRRLPARRTWARQAADGLAKEGAM